MSALKPLVAAMSLVLPAAAMALDFGEWTLPNGSVLVVEEDFMDARYPRHLIILHPEDGLESDGALVLRCEQNRTEVYFSSGDYEFFGHGTSPEVAVRFPSDDRANRQSVGLSTDAEAVFFDNPVAFLVRLAEDGSVGLEGSYFGGSFRHRFVLDARLQAALRDMAQTCEWADRLPPLPETAGPVTLAAGDGEMDRTDAELLMAITALIEEFGADRVRQALADAAPVVK